jgi:hypothetical protein
MRSLVLSVAVAVVILTAAAPGAFAADPSVTGDPVVATNPTAAPTGPYDGQIVEDPTFVSGGTLPTQPPGRPDSPARPLVTPPATDSVATGTGPGSSSPAMPLLILAASAVTALVAAPRPMARRSTRRA